MLSEIKVIFDKKEDANFALKRIGTHVFSAKIWQDVLAGDNIHAVNFGDYVIVRSELFTAEQMASWFRGLDCIIQKKVYIDKGYSCQEDGDYTPDNVKGGCATAIVALLSGLLYV